MSVTGDLLFEKDRPTVLVGRFFLCFVVAALATCGWLPTAAQERLKEIVDQDARGPGTGDHQAILVFLQSQRFEVLGVTTVSGDQWVKEEFEIDAEKFYELYVDLMTRPPRQQPRGLAQ